MSTAAQLASEAPRTRATHAWASDAPRDGSIDTDLDGLAELAAAVTACAAGRVVTPGPDGVATKGHYGADVFRLTDASTVGWVCANGAHYAEESDVDARDARRLVAAVPVKGTDGSTLAVVLVADPAPRILTHRQRALLERIAHQVTVVLEARKKDREAAVRFQDALDAIPHMILVKAKGSRIVWVNKALETFYGVNRDELVGKLDAPYVPPDQTLDYVRDDAYVFDTGKQLEIAAEPATRHDGEVREFHTFKTPVFGRDGRVELLVAVCEDITLNRARDRKLDETSALLSGLVEHAPAIVIINDLEGRFLLVNRGFERAFEVPRERVLGRTRSAILGDAEAARLEEADLAVVRTRAPLSFEFRVPTSGVDRVYRVTKFPVTDAGGAVTAVCTISADVSAEKSAESNANAIIAALPDKVFTFDRNDRLLSFHYPPGSTGVRPLDGLVGRSVRELLPPEPGRLICEAMARARASRTVQIVEYMLPQGPDGALRAHEERVSATEDGTLVIVSRDVEERKQIAEKLRETAQIKSEFLANMSHEIRTPMNGVVGVTHLLSSTALSPEQREYVDLLRDSCDVLTAIIDDVLDLSKIESGKFRIEPAAFDLRALCVSVVRSFGLQKTSHNVPIELHLSEALSCELVGDAGRIRQVLVNLVGNAAKFTAKGRISVSVEPSAHARDGAVGLRFSVTDTGIGVSPEQASRVFEPFVQADGSTTRKYGGTGLGLSICKQLVERMGGTIGVDSQLGRGSSFWFTLELPRVIPGVSPSRPAMAPPTSRRVGGARVLLVEDNGVNQTVARKLLERLGCQVELARNGRECVEIVQASRADGLEYDVLFMDCQMPEMDGYEATALLRREGTTSPIIAMTAGVMPGDREKCLDVGMDDYLTKPLSPIALKAKLAVWLARAPSATPFRRTRSA